MQRASKRQKLSHSKEDDLHLLLLNQLKRTLHASDDTISTLFNSLKQQQLLPAQPNSLCAISDLFSTSEPTGKILIGRILPRFKTKVHLTSLFFTQSESSTIDIQQPAHEIVCEICSDRNEDMCLSYLNHWYLFYDWTFVASESIVSCTAGRSFPDKQKFSYLEITVSPTTAICLNKILNRGFDHIYYFPPSSHFVCDDNEFMGIMSQASSKVNSVVGRVVLVSPLFTKRQNIQFIVKVDITGLDNTFNENREFSYIVFSSEFSNLLPCFYSFIRVGQRYIFLDLMKAKISSSGQSLTMVSIHRTFMVTEKTSFYPLPNIKSRQLNTSSSQITCMTSTTAISDDCVSQFNRSISSINREEAEHIRSQTCNYVGQITSTEELYTHARFQIDTEFTVYLMHFPMINFGRGIRVGATVELHCVHPLYMPSNSLEAGGLGELHGLGLCKASKIQINKFSKQNTLYRPLVYSIDRQQLKSNGQIMLNEPIWTELASLHPHYLVYLNFLERCKQKFSHIFSSKDLDRRGIVKHLFDIFFASEEKSSPEHSSDNIFLYFMQHNEECSLVSSYRPIYSDMNSKLPIIITVQQLKEWSEKVLKNRDFEDLGGCRVVADIPSNWILLATISPSSSNTRSDLYLQLSDQTGQIPIQLVLGDLSQLQPDWSRYSKDIYHIQNYRVVYDDLLPSTIFIQVLKLKLCLKCGHGDAEKQRSTPNQQNTLRLKITFISSLSSGRDSFSMKCIVIRSSDPSLRMSVVDITLRCSFALGLFAMLRTSHIIDVTNAVMKSKSSLEINDDTQIVIADDQSQLSNVRQILATPVVQSAYAEELVSVKGYLLKRKKLDAKVYQLTLRDVSTPDLIDVYFHNYKKFHGTLVGSIPKHVQILLYSVEKKQSGNSGKVYLSSVSGNTRVLQIPCSKNQHLTMLGDIETVRLCSLYNGTKRSNNSLFKVTGCSIVSLYRLVYRVGESWCNMCCSIDDGTQRALMIVREVEVLKSLFPGIDQTVTDSQMDPYNTQDLASMIPIEEVFNLRFNLYAKMGFGTKSEQSSARSDGKFHNPFQPKVNLQLHQEEQQMVKNEKVTIIAESCEIITSLSYTPTDVKNSLETELSTRLANLSSI